MASVSGTTMSSGGSVATWRHRAWLAVLVIAISGFSFVFACATPFAAFGAIAALTLARRDALRITLALWLADQLVGYGIHGYPRTADSFAWGAALGVAAVLATLVARGIAVRLRTAGPLAQALAALLGAFAVYEVALFTVAVAGLGGTESFTLAIVSRILAINAVALVGLYVLHRIAAVVGLSDGPSLPFPLPVRRSSL
jgi:hypothetical protein